MQEEASLDLYNPLETDICSDAFYKFITEYDDLMRYFFFVVTLSSHFDDVRDKAARVLATIDSQKLDETKLKKSSAFAILRRHASLNSRLLTVNMVDNFLCYLSEIVQTVMSKRVEVLRSREQLTLEEVFQFTKFSDLTAYVVDKKINDLSYGGLNRMEEFMRDRLGVEMFESEEVKTLLTIFIELRNIHTHNRSVVNDLFLSRVGDSIPRFKFVKGRTYFVNFDEFSELSRNAIHVALGIDSKLCTKFKLQRSRYKRRLEKERKKKASEKPRPISDSSQATDAPTQ